MAKKLLGKFFVQVAFQIYASIWNFIVSMWYGADPVVFTSYGECVQVCSCRDAACEVFIFEIGFFYDIFV